MRFELTAMLAVAVLSLLAAGLLCMVLSLSLRRTDPGLYSQLGSPIAYEWYPFWVFQFLSPRKFKQLRMIDRLIAVAASAGMVVALTCFVAVGHMLLF